MNSQNESPLLFLFDINKKTFFKYNPKIPDRELTVLSEVHPKIKIDPVEIDNSQHNFEWWTEEIEANHLRTVTQLTVKFWEDILGHSIRWAWYNRFPDSPLCIYPFSPLIEAEYRRQRQSISLGIHDISGKRIAYSFDIVCHEITHAIIDSIRRDLGPLRTKDVIKIIEQICDISAMLTYAFYRMPLEGHHHSYSFLTMSPNHLTEFAEGYGSNGRDGIRSALDDPDSITYLAYVRLIDIFARTALEDRLHEELITLGRLFFKPLAYLEDLSFKSYTEPLQL